MPNKRENPPIVRKSAKQGQKATTTANHKTHMIPARPNLSNCGSDYARAIANPFTGPLACVPGQFPIQTRKLRVYTRGTFYIGMNSAGFIFASPPNAIANDSDCVNFSTNNYAGDGTFTGIADGGPYGTVAGARSNSDYTKADFGGTGGTSQMRIVSAGLRVRYTGKELDKSGSMYAFQDPTHNSLVGVTPTQIANEAQARRCQVSREWTTVLYNPVQESDYQLTTNSFPPSIGSGSALAWYMGVMVTGCVVTGSSFDYEFYVTYEVNGRNVRGMTRTHSDPLAVAAVVNVATAQPPVSGQIEQHEKSFLARVSENLGSALSHGADLYNMGNALYSAGKKAQNLGSLPGIGRTMLAYGEDVLPLLSAL